jgi:hypothetical protein
MRALPRSPLLLFLVPTLALAGPASVSPACGYVAPAASKAISVRVGSGVEIGVEASLWKVEGAKDSCSASSQVEFSSFPSSSLATRPADVAAVLQETAEEWGVET